MIFSLDLIIISLIINQPLLLTKKIIFNIYCFFLLLIKNKIYIYTYNNY